MVIEKLSNAWSGKGPVANLSFWSLHSSGFTCQPVNARPSACICLAAMMETVAMPLTEKSPFSLSYTAPPVTFISSVLQLATTPLELPLPPSIVLLWAILPPVMVNL